MSRQTGNPAVDPVLCEFALPLQSTHYPLGFPLELATNSEDVLKAAQESWGVFGKAFAEQPVQLRIGVLEGNEEAHLTAPIVRSRQHLIAWVAGLDNFGLCDMRQGFGFGWIAASTASHHAHLRYHYLEAMAYTLLQCRYLTPIHAACVALNGRGVLLCGDSEAGKSSLAYACARRGWTYISDDACYLVRSWNRNVVVGNPHVIRLRESAPELFPELRRHPVILRAQGDRAIELATAAEPNLLTAPHSSIDHVVFLNRQSIGRPLLTAFPKEKALRWLEGVLCFGERDVREAQAASLRSLLGGDVLEFRYSDLDAAEAELKSLVGFAEHKGRARALSPGCQDNV